jgi:hypothetical protein
MINGKKVWKKKYGLMVMINTRTCNTHSYKNYTAVAVYGCSVYLYVEGVCVWMQAVVQHLQDDIVHGTLC